MNKEPKDPTKLFNLIWLIGAVVFCVILYFAFNWGYLPLLAAVIVGTFGATMYILNRNKNQ